MRAAAPYLVIAIGSALGGLARYGTGLLAVALWGPGFPWGTIIINVLGSFVIGAFATLTGPDGRLYVGPLGRQLVMVGLCGGYTTFSAFSLETLELIERARPLAAAANIALSLALGSALGGVARYALSGFIARRFGETFPWGTLIVNVSGCAVIGVFAALIAPAGPWPGSLTVRALVLIGLCGGYTTFSSFSLQTLILAREGEWGRALGNVTASVAFCYIALWLGYRAGALCFGG